MAWRMQKLEGFNGGGSWVGELLGVADVIKGQVRLEQTSHSSIGW